MKRLLPILILAGCTTAPAPAARQIHATCETPALPPAPVRGPGVLPVPGPQTETPSPETPESPKADKPKGNASGNNGRGGNYSRTGHADNGKGRGKGRR